MKFVYNGWDREYLENKDAYLAMFDNSIQYEQDTDVPFLEEAVAKVSGRKHVISTASATDALQFSLQAHGVGPGDEVLVPDFSWIASATVVSMVGATPVFCDIDLHTYHMRLESIKRMVTKQTKAIVYPHLFGYMSLDVFEILEYCQENDIAFIEDAAHAIGASLNGVKAGTLGTGSAYSFNDNKTISGLSGGGVFLTDDEDKAIAVEKMCYHGRGRDFSTKDVVHLGRNSKMHLMNAEVITMRLGNIEKYQKRRQEIAKIYDEFFETQPVHIQKKPEGLVHNYHKYVIRFDSKEMRDTVKGLTGASVHYDPPISENSVYKNITHKRDTYLNTTTAKTVSDTIMSMPIHAWMTDDEVETICDIMEQKIWEAESQIV